MSFRTGDAHISTVDGDTETMTVRDNGKVVRTLPVSLGAAHTPTRTGVKVVMQKGEQADGSSALRPDGTVRVRGRGHDGGPVYNDLVKWSVRITADGEYVHAAPWNSRIGRMSNSNGCTNLTTSDARWFYGFARLGDVVTFGATSGTPMPATTASGTGTCRGRSGSAVAPCPPPDSRWCTGRRRD